MPKVNAHTGGLGCLYTAITVSMMKAAPCTIHHADIAFSLFVILFIGSCFYTGKSSEHHVQYHHQRETYCKADSADVAVLALRHFGD